VVVSALPDQGQAINIDGSYGFDYTLNAYLATRLAQGWNLRQVTGAGLATFADGLSHIVSAWQWTGGLEPTWAVDFPNAAPGVLDAYVKEKGFVALTTIKDDGGVWLLCDTAGVEEGSADTLDQQSLTVAAGWNLLASQVPSRVPVSSVVSGQGAMTFWGWDAGAGRWAFFSTAMDAPALAAYTNDKGFTELTHISYGDGFWVHGNAPAVLTLQ
jgi:hypothetical protein